MSKNNTKYKKNNNKTKYTRLNIKKIIKKMFKNIFSKNNNFD